MPIVIQLMPSFTRGDVNERGIKSLHKVNQLGDKVERFGRSPTLSCFIGQAHGFPKGQRKFAGHLLWAMVLWFLNLSVHPQCSH